ncbi:M3 family metallopeptidase [Acinetobacter baumannii]|nr:M3 family metallopeptidase [Acinetobacter baumannii]EGJ61110.1 peptidase family M3 [Acinetobacter baumannii 6013150]EGJ66149.1 peptidase family M3 [Acinetobacter baumannii 6013113]EHU1795781.1 Zn-dependent oligopeptidase [Acinetobacter baumannii]EHU2742787.1 Zn-dependent oligopeptidase [Acinetobacter baumannii]EHU2745132.1 Zn-dependent oligopeptidase [Acinetobacter baumannii]
MKKIGDTMKNNTLKMTTLCMLTIGISQFASAEATRATLPLLKAEQLPVWCDSNLKKIQQEISSFEKTPVKNDATAAPILAKWDKIFAHLEDFSGPIGLYSNVDPDAKLRKAAEDCEIKINQFHTDIFQNSKLYNVIKNTKANDPIDQKYRQDILDQFEDTGVQLEPAKRARMKAILDELTKLEQEYNRNIRDNPGKLEFTPEEMKGLPESYISGLKKNTKGNYLLGFEYPEYRPFMELADNDDARKRYQIAFTRRGTEQNLKLLKQAIDLRYELAQLFGKASYADWALKDRMAKTPEAVNKFLAEVQKTVAPLERKEVEELRAFKAQTLKTPLDKTEITRWSEAYWSEKLRKSKYQIDQEKLRDYFPTLAAQKWLFAISSDLYGIDFKPVKVKAWQDEVEYYDVVDKKTGKLLGGLYMDKFPREGKYGHAAVWGVYGGSTLTNRLPISVLVTNFNRKGLNSDELETFVHEFGHALHGILSNTRYTSQSGTSVERDFVEAPSQMYEEWARRKETLSKVADYCDPACPRVDDELIARLKAVHNYGRGLRYARQTLYAQYDMALHTADALKVKPLETWQKMEAATALGYVPTTEFPGQFGHLMGGYQAGYYGYMWSEVLALDMLSAYGDNLNNPQVGQRYRQTILSQGSQKPAAELVKDFLGRDPDNKAFFNEITGQRVK